jgi:hypothetical protein
MTTMAREYAEFWAENSIHAREPDGSLGAEQDLAELVRALIEGAKGQGVSEQDMIAEVGDLREYVGNKLLAANQIENSRRK